jgi:hypothetical protein
MGCTRQRKRPPLAVWSVAVRRCDEFRIFPQPSKKDGCAGNFRVFRTFSEFLWLGFSS